MRKVIYKLLYLYHFVLNYPNLFIKRVKYGGGLRLRGRVYIKRGGNSTGGIFIGNNVCINSSIAANPIGGSCKTIFNVRNKGRIVIGDGVGISNTAIVSDSEVYIGKSTNIGAGTCIYDTDFHSLNPKIRMNGDTDIRTKPVHIGKNVFIGGHCVILKGVTIGDGAVIGAGSVVTKSIPAGEIWAGNPAKFIRKVPSLDNK